MVEKMRFVQTVQQSEIGAAGDFRSDLRPGEKSALRPCEETAAVSEGELVILDHKKSGYERPKVPCFLEVFCYIKPSKKHGTFGGPGRGYVFKMFDV